MRLDQLQKDHFTAELELCVRWALQSTACAGFVWDRVNFLHRSWDGAVFCVCAGNSGMFQVLLSTPESADNSMGEIHAGMGQA